MDFADVTAHPSLFPDPEATRKEIVTLLQDLIRNRCVNYGNGACQEERSILTVQKYLAREGVKCTCHHAPGKPKRLNLLAQLGTGEPRLMLGPSHVDVVPVEGEAAPAEPEGDPDGGTPPPGWDFPPFSGVLHEGVVYGRGAIDMLSTVACQAVVFATLARTKWAMRGTLLLCLVSDEEAGSADGAEFITSDRLLSSTYRTDYALTEVGGATLPNRHNNPTRKYFEAVGEKGVGEVRVRCLGRGGHGSIPKNADNALTKAATVISRVNSYTSPTVVLSEWKSFVQNLDAPLFVRFMLSTSFLVPLALRLLRLVKSPLLPLADALTRLTMVATHVRGTLKDNVIPGAVEVDIDVRTLPGQDEAYLLEHVRRALGSRISNDTEHYSIEVKRFQPATSSPTTGKGAVLWDATGKAAAAVVPGATVVPAILPGATDSRFFRGSGTVAYGANLFAPEITTTELSKRFHGTNERICVRSLWASCQFYMLVVRQVLS